MGFINKLINIFLICAYVGIHLDLRINNKPVIKHFLNFINNIISKYNLCKNGVIVNLVLNNHKEFHVINEPGNHHLLIYLIKYQSNDQMVYISTHNSAGLVDLIVLNDTWQQIIVINKYFSEKTHMKITYTTSHHINSIAEKTIIPKMPLVSNIFLSINVI